MIFLKGRVTGYLGRVGSGWPVIKSGRVTGQPVFGSG